MTDPWREYLLDCLRDVQTAIGNPDYSDEQVQYALYQRERQLTEWLADNA